MLVCTIDFSQFGSGGLLPKIADLIPKKLFAEMQKMGLDAIPTLEVNEIQNCASAYISYRDNLSDMIAQMQNFCSLQLSQYNLDDAIYTFITDCIQKEVKTLREARSQVCKFLDRILEMEDICRRAINEMKEQNELFKQYVEISIAWYKTHPTGDSENPADAIFQKLQTKWQHNGVSN